MTRAPENTTQDYRKYLDPKVLARIGSLELRARFAVEGHLTGMHRSPYRGLSIEFAGHRSYAQGDDVRHIDWKVFGRTNKYYIKEYEQETNLDCVVVMDCSESMAYQSPDAIMSKREYAACVAASLAYLALRQRDAVGLVLFSDRITRFVKPSNVSGHWKTLVDGLSEPGERGSKGDPGASGVWSDQTNVRRVLDDLAERLQRRTLIILISDLFDDVSETLMGLKRLRHNKNELIVLNIWDPAEMRFPFEGLTMFEGLEGSGRVMTDPRSLRTRYLSEVRRFVGALRRGCREMQIDFVRLDTSLALDSAVSAYLTTRSASIRQRSSRVLGGG